MARRNICFCASQTSCAPMEGARSMCTKKTGLRHCVAQSAELYLRWERDLKHRDITLSARVLEFPGGKLADIGPLSGVG